MVYKSVPFSRQSSGITPSNAGFPRQKAINQSSIAVLYNQPINVRGRD